MILKIMQFCRDNLLLIATDCKLYPTSAVLKREIMHISCSVKFGRRVVVVIRWVAQVYSFRAESVEDNDKSDHERGWLK